MSAREATREEMKAMSDDELSQAIARTPTSALVSVVALYAVDEKARQSRGGWPTPSLDLMSMLAGAAPRDPFDEKLERLVCAELDARIPVPQGRKVVGEA